MEKEEIKNICVKLFINSLVFSRCKDNIGLFHKFVHFFTPAKNQRINDMLNSYSKASYKESFIDPIIQITELNYKNVYDVTVSEVHEFCANGIRAHNCS